MSIPKYIMDMTDKIPKYKEEDIIIARIPKDYTQRISEIIPKNM